MFGFYKEYYSFSGRTPRWEYWTAHIVISIVGVVLTFGSRFLVGQIMGIDLLSNLSAVSLNPSKLQSTTMGDVFLSFGVLIGFVILNIILFVWPFWATIVRRLHDLNLSGWFSIIIPAIITAIIYGLAYTGGKTAGGMSYLVLWGLYYGMLLFISGTKGPNNYGADQRELNAYFKQRKLEKKIEWKHSQLGDKK